MLHLENFFEKSFALLLTTPNANNKKNHFEENSFKNLQNLSF